MDAHYRVPIFGSVRIKEGDKDYQEIFSLSRGLAEACFDIVTGGIGTLLELFYSCQLT